ncbi:hypothetical protein BST97_06595 [Nonlabens spongiae]|uniref:Uncharacterized protein n=1 Tax=Nonlabens spongiae TaxID=331648 RepID=A0A1W6MJD2_9FLAO|nr:hypothetical protein [Nonlabens spongiae]ARN77692.1 hypothetical protein BST97_06595 [Nonlabens spongiae]
MSTQFRCLLLIFVLLVTSNSFSQVKRTYSDSIVLLQNPGVVEYDYYLSQKDTVKNGKFRFHATSHTSDGNEIPLLEITGSFKNGKPDKEWILKMENYELADKKQFKNYRFVTELNGKESIVSGSFKNGLPNGEWRVIERIIASSQITDTIYDSSNTYDAGVPIQTLRINAADGAVIGRRLRNGFAQGDWSFISQDGLRDEETWEFENGLLRFIGVIQENGVQQIPMFDADKENYQNSVLDRHYLDIIKLTEESQDASVRSSIIDLIDRDLEFKNSFLEIMKALNVETSLHLGKVRIPYFPLTKKEQNLIDQISRSFYDSKEVSDIILNNTQLAIRKLSNPQIDGLYRLTQNIDSTYLIPSQRLVNYYERDLMTYEPRENIVQKLFENPELETNSLIENQSAEEIVSLEDVLRTLENVQENLDKIKELLKDDIDAQQLRTKFLPEESALIADSQRLSSKIDSLANTINQNQSDAMKGLKPFLVSRLTEYANMPEGFSKLDQAKSLQQCFNKVDVLLDTLAVLPEKQKQIDYLYKDKIFNPFTSTLMDGKIKKRITEAYYEKAMPYLLKQVAQLNSCDDIDELTAAFDSLHQRLVALRDEETYRLERRLRKADDPVEVLRLFQVDTPFNF